MQAAGGLGAALPSRTEPHRGPAPTPLPSVTLPLPARPFPSAHKPTAIAQRKNPPAEPSPPRSPPGFSRLSVCVTSQKVCSEDRLCVFTPDPSPSPPLPIEPDRLPSLPSTPPPGGSSRCCSLCLRDSSCASTTGSLTLLRPPRWQPTQNETPPGPAQGPPNHPAGGARHAGKRSVRTVEG